MLNIHEVRTRLNYNAFDQVCKKEKIEFFVMVDLVKLLKETLDYGEEIEGKRIEFSRVKDKHTLERLLVEAHTLLDVGSEAFCLKPETEKIIEKIYELQKEERRYELKYMIEFGRVQFIP